MKKLFIFLSLVVSLFGIGLEKSCQLNNGAACFSLSIDYFGLKKYKKAFFYAKKSCGLNNAKGCMNLALLYKHGVGINKDFLKYRQYVEKSCNLGFLNACKELKIIKYNEEMKNNILSIINNNVNFCKLSHDKLKQYINFFEKKLKDRDLNLNFKKYMMYLEVDTLLDRYNRISYIVNTPEGFVTKTAIAENEAEADVEQGYIPATFQINVSNLLTKKGRITATFNAKNIAVILVKYLFPSHNMKKAIYRNILMRAYFLNIGSFSFDKSCKSFDGWHDILMISYLNFMFRSYKFKQKDSIKALFLLLNHNFNGLDKFLSSNSNVKKLTNYGLNLFYGKLKNAK